MGLFSFIDKAMDTVTTTVKSLVGVETAPAVKKTAQTKKNVPMVSQEAQAKNKNEDKVELSQKTQSKNVNKIYERIGELCSDYRMSMEDVRKAKLLESIAGCTTEELATKSEEEINAYIESLKFVLRVQSWKFPWDNRDINDIKEIAEKANKRCTYLATGGDCVTEFFRSKKSLGKRLKEEGFANVTAESVKTFFHAKLSKAIASNDKEDIQDAYEKNLELLGQLLNDTEDPNERAALTAAISELQAGDRKLAAKLSVSSCGCHAEAKQKTARGLSNNYKAISCEADALGNYTKEEDNISISETSFANMNETDTMEVLANMKNDISDIQGRMQRGEPVSDIEKRYVTQACSQQYAGGLVGCSYNTNLSTDARNNAIGTIDRDTQEAGIQAKVYSQAANYAKNHSGSIPGGEKQFTERVDKVTGGNYSKVIKNSQNNNTNTRTDIGTKTQKTSTDKTPAKDEVKAGNPKPETNNDALTSTQKEPSKTNGAKGFTTTPILTPKVPKASTTQNPFGNVENSKISKPDTAQKTVSKAPAVPQKTSSAVTTPKANVSRTEEEVILGGVSSLIQYAKENKKSSFEVAIMALNSKSADKVTRDWARTQYLSSSKSEQVLNFNRISREADAIAIAQEMDEQTRKKINTFRSVDLRRTIEGLENKERV